MRAFNIVILFLLAVAAVFFFGKPSDDVCIVKGKEAVIGGAFVIPGYSNPSDKNTSGPINTESLLIKDKFLWKEVDYIGKGQIKTIGYAYLGSFHIAKN